MALATCVECGKEVSASAKTCPHCGRANPTRRPRSNKTVLAVIVGSLVAAALLSKTSPSTPNTASGGSSSEQPALPSPPAAPSLELLAFTWSEDATYAIARGQVKNVSSQSLENVAAVVTYYDKAGGFITSDDAMIDYDPILPGQTSPFRVTEKWNPAMASATMEFKVLFGGAIEHIDRTRK